MHLAMVREDFDTGDTELAIFSDDTVMGGTQDYRSMSSTLIFKLKKSGKIANEVDV